MNKRFLPVVLMAILIVISLYFNGGDKTPSEPSVNQSNPPSREAITPKETPQPIDKLTAQDNVVSFMKKYQKLPAFYMTKKQAREAGWDAKKVTFAMCYLEERLAATVFLTVRKVYPLHKDANGLKQTLIIAVVIAGRTVCYTHQMG